MQYFKRLVISLLLGGNVFIIAFLWLCCACTMVSPSAVPQCVVLTLVFPLFLFADIAFFLFWLIFKARYALVPLLGMLVAGGYVLDYCPLNFQNKETTDSTLLVVSYNIGGVGDEEGFSDFSEFMRQTGADILCLQEVSPTLLTMPCFKAVADSLGYNVLSEGTRCIVSRLPVVEKELPEHVVDESGNGTQVCFLQHGADTLLVVNNHLESYRLTDGEKSDYKNAIKHPDSKQSVRTGFMLARRIAGSARGRGMQVDSLCRIIDTHRNYSTIVCGDFNDTPISYVCQQVGKRLQNAWRRGGCGVGVSYNQAGFYVRIDHLFFSPDWTCVSAQMESGILLSDHYPLFAYLRKTTE